MGKFKAGKSGNPAGRPAGSKNVLTKTLRSKLKTLIDSELDQLPALLDGLPPEKRLDIIIKLIAYTLPRVNPVSSKAGESLDMDFI